jgi:hypothetical protein
MHCTVVHLSVTLPRFSQAGRYEIRVSKDKAGTQVVAQGAGAAVDNAGNTEVKVELDLRAAKAGWHVLPGHGSRLGQWCLVLPLEN